MEIRKAKVILIVLVCIGTVCYSFEYIPPSFEHSTSQYESISIGNASFYLITDANENDGDLISCRRIEAEPEEIRISRVEFRNNYVIVRCNNQSAHTCLILMYDLQKHYRIGYELHFGLANMYFDNAFVIDEDIYYFKLKAHLIYKLGAPVMRYAVPTEEIWKLINYDEQIEGLSLKHDDIYWSIEEK